MDLNRRNLLAGGAAAGALSTFGASAFAALAMDVAIPKDALIYTFQLKAKAGEEERMKEALATVVGPTRQEEGCILYILQQAADDKTLFMFYEVWASRDAIQKHRQTPHLMALGPKLAGLIDAPGRPTAFKPIE